MIILGVRNFRVFEILEHLPYALRKQGKCIYTYDPKKGTFTNSTNLKFLKKLLSKQVHG